MFRIKVYTEKDGRAGRVYVHGFKTGTVRTGTIKYVGTFRSDRHPIRVDGILVSLDLRRRHRPLLNKETPRVPLSVPTVTWIRVYTHRQDRLRGVLVPRLRFRGFTEGVIPRVFDFELGLLELTKMVTVECPKLGRGV